MEVLENLIYKLKQSKGKCNYTDNCYQPPAAPFRHGIRDIYICKKYVYKGPTKKTTSNVILKNRAFKLIPFNISLLFQTVLNTLIKNNKIKGDEVEHYTSICSKNDVYRLKTIKLGWSDNNMTHHTIEDYLLNTETIDTSLVLKWLKQLFHILDRLYNLVQFHHCDPKASQVLLNENGNVVLADFDKCTFTMNINDTHYHIQTKTNHLHNTFFYLGKKMGILSGQYTKMRFYDLPHIDNHFEKYCFLSSICILSGSKQLSNIIEKEGRKLIRTKCKVKCNKTRLVIPKSFDYTRKNVKVQKTTVFADAYVDYPYKEFVPLKSMIYLDKTLNLRTTH